jgi:hypothetical protein
LGHASETRVHRRRAPHTIRRVDANTHYGTLLDAITLKQDPTMFVAPWTKNTHGQVTVVRTVQ